MLAVMMVEQTKLPSDPLICVVDDHESVRDALMGLLRSYGLRVACYESAETFRDSAALLEVDCLILDVHLPGMSGPDLMSELAARELRPPVILISGAVDAHTRKLIDRAAPHALLIKPFQDDHLLHALQRALHEQDSKGRPGHEH
ncbi:MAG TPA: response regulator [Polyangiales bacterium]|nr:response regulator [Polyangiales bacterium]